MLSEPRYVAGRFGARVTYVDGTRVDYPPHALVRLDMRVRAVDGKLYRLNADGAPTYEAPEFTPRSPHMTTTEDPRPPDPEPMPPAPPAEGEDDEEEDEAEEEPAQA
jgi:hypothetical protein